MEKHSHIFTMTDQANVEVRGWVADDCSIMFKCIAVRKDPVELTSHDAREIAHWLIKVADIVDADSR